MSEGIGKLNDGDVALIGNIVERIRVARQFDQKALVLTPFEMEAAWKAGLIALSSEAGRDSAAAAQREAEAETEALRAKVAGMAETLRQILAFKPARNQMTVLFNAMQSRARAALKCHMDEEV